MQLVLDLLVPGIIAGVSCYGMAKRVDVYDALLQGAARGWRFCCGFCPLWSHCSRWWPCSGPRGRWNWRRNCWRPPWSGWVSRQRRWG